MGSETGSNSDNNLQINESPEDNRLTVMEVPTIVQTDENQVISILNQSESPNRVLHNIITHSASENFSNEETLNGAE